jgi:hypothetical protein
MDSVYVKIFIALIVLALIKPIVRIVFCLLLRTVLRGWLSKVGEKAMAEQPDEIHLVPEPDHAWTNRDAVEAMAAPLTSLGFEEAGLYSISEMNGVYVRLMAHPAQSIAACLYEHPQVGTWMDLVCKYSDGRSITYTTGRPTGLEKRPGCQTVNAPEMGAEALYQRLLRERPTGDLTEITPTSVPTLFMEAYKKETAWRKNKGISVEEVARQMELTVSES